MKRITFSALPRLFECPASHVLPHTRDDEPSEARDRGIAVHKYLEHYRKWDSEMGLARVPEEHREFCEAIPVDLLPVNLSREVKLAYDPWTRKARVLTSKGHRDYSQAKDHEIVGTVDVLGLNPDAVFVGDYKTGWAKLLAAIKNPQLLAGALAACRALDRDGAIVSLIRVHEDKTWSDTAEVDLFDLLGFEERLVKLDLLIRQLSTTDDQALQSYIHPGPHCRYCPAFERCPEQTQLAERATNGTLALEVERWTGILDASNAAEAYGKAKLMMRLAVRADRIMRAYGRKHTIDLGGGRRFGRVDHPGNERLDGEITWTQAVRLFGHDVANAMMTRRVTKKAIDSALRRHKLQLGTTQAEAKRALLGAVRDAGGSVRKPTSRVEEFEVVEEEG
jgi:hypothetical protein